MNIRHLLYVLVFLGFSAFAQNELTVLSVSPKGELSLNNQHSTQITINFSEPMVALGEASIFESIPFVQIEPAVDGSFSWLGTQTLGFTPKSIEPATRYSVKVTTEATSINGNSLAENVEWTFETPRPELGVFFPFNYHKQFEPSNPVLLEFNLDIAPTRLTDSIRLIEFLTKRKIDIEISNADSLDLEGLYSFGNDYKKIIKIQPVQPLKKGTEYLLKISKGTLAAKGHLGTREETLVNFSTFGPLNYTGLGTFNVKYPKTFSPTQSVYLFFSNPVTGADLVNHLHIEPPVAIPEHYENRTWGSRKVELFLNWKPDETYKIVIDSELNDTYGQSLGKTIVDSFKTSSYQPYASIPTGPGIVESYGNRLFPLTVVNKNSVTVNMKKINPEELIPLLAGEQSLFYSMEKQQGLVFSKTFNFSHEKNTRAVEPLNLDWVLQDQPSGFALVGIESKNHNNEPVYNRALLQVTNIGVSAKFSPFNNIVWVTDLQNAEPIADATVQVRDDKNRVLWTGKTGQYGLVETPGWKKLNIEPPSEWDKPRQWIFVYHENDVAYTASDWGTGIYPYRFGIDYDWNPSSVKTLGQIFTDRGLYKAGETVHLKGIIRQKENDGWQVWSNKNVKLTVRNSRDELILDQKITTSDFGSFDADLKLKKNAGLGYYWVSVDTTNKNGYDDSIAFTEFRVEAFRPATFQVDAKYEKNEYVMGDSPKCMVNASYLFGTPVADQPADWNFSLQKTSFDHPDFSDYNFGPIDWLHDQYDREYISLNHGKNNLDENGNLSITTQLDESGLVEPYRLTATVDVTGPDRQHIATSQQTIVHPAEFYVGVNISSVLAQAKKPVPYQLVTINPQGDLVSDKKISVKITNRQWHSIRKAGIGGRYHWISEPVETVVDSLEIVSKSKRVEKEFIPEKSGIYIVQTEASDSRGNTTVTEAYFYATGSDYIAWHREDDDMLELVVNANEYKPGDTAKIMIKSPYQEAQALVSVEREGVIDYFTETVTGNSPVINLLIKDNYLPNVFVSVILLQGRATQPTELDQEKDIGKPSFKIGYVNLPVNSSQKKLSVNVSADASKYSPKDKVTLNIELEDYKDSAVSGEVSIAVIDKGVLNLIGYECPNPFDLFYGQRMLSVQTAETRLHVLEQRNYGQKGENPGGGGGKALAGADIRKQLKACAYWNPSVIVDDYGVATVDFELPENLTSYKIMAVAHTKDSEFGMGTSEFTVSKPLLVQPALPRFVRVDDEFAGGVIVHNHSGQSGEAKISVLAENIEINGDASKKVLIENGQSKRIDFQFKNAQNDSAKITFVCVLGDLSDGLELKIPVNMPRRYESVALYKKTSESTNEQIDIPENIFADQSELQLTMASTGLAEMTGSLDYLINYPYDCLEQKTSKIFPYLAAQDLISVGFIDTLDYSKTVQTILDEIADFQNDDGGMGLWPGLYYSSPYLTTYAAHALTLAKSAGFSVDENVLLKSLDYLHYFLTDEYQQQNLSEGVKQTISTYIIYVLALNDQYENGYIDNFAEQFNSLPLIAQSYVLKTIARRFIVDNRISSMNQSLMNRMNVSSSTAFFESSTTDFAYTYSSDTKTTAIVLQTLIESSDDFIHSEKVLNWLLLKRKKGHWQNTHENALVLAALNAYFKKYESVPPNFESIFKIDEKTITEKSFAGRSKEIDKTVILLNQFEAGVRNLDITKNGDGTLYYGARMTYYPKDFLPAKDMGFTILKNIQSAEGGSVKEMIAGNVYKISLKIIVPADRQFVVVDDPLPAGFEPLNLTLRNNYDDGPFYSGFNHVEKHDDKVLLFANYVNAGVHDFEYSVRATSTGTFQIPGTYAEEMYTPDLFGRTASQEIVIK